MEEKSLYGAFRLAMVEEFNALYGVDENDVHSWRKLCFAIGVPPEKVPWDLATCRKTVQNTHVNIVDLIDLRRTHQKVKIFKTSKELGSYTFKEGKVFPLNVAKAGGVLNLLLRKIGSGPRRRRSSSMQF